MITVSTPIKRGTAARLGLLRRPRPNLIITLSRDLTEDELEEFKARFDETARHGRSQFIYPTVGPEMQWTRGRRP